MRLKRWANVSTDGLYRWALTREWGRGKRVCWIMLNPSTADSRKDDPTIRSIVKRSQNWDYKRLVVVNLYPFRSSSPTECKSWDEGQRHDSDPKERNQGHVIYEAFHSDLVVAAWGAHTWISTSLVNLLPPELWCIGKTKHGAPKHPLARGLHRVLEDTPPELWRPS